VRIANFQNATLRGSPSGLRMDRSWHATARTSNPAAPSARFRYPVARVRASGARFCRSCGKLRAAFIRNQSPQGRCATRVVILSIPRRRS